MCPRCTSTSKRKRHIRCYVCGQHWHLSCVHLTRAQADTLGCWWCPTCVNNSSANSAPSQPTLPLTTCQSQPAPQSPPSQDTELDLALLLANLKQTRPVVRRIPRGARIAAAEALSLLIDSAVDSGTSTSWSRLLCFPYAAFSVPRHETHKTENASLTSKVKRSISAYMDVNSAEPINAETFLSGQGCTKQKDPKVTINRHPSNARNSGERLKRCVALKLQDGDVRGAIRLLASAENIAQESDDVSEVLKAKHPGSPGDLDLPPGPDNDTQPFLATDTEVLASVASLDPGASAGLDGLRPAHLKDLVGRSAGEAGARLVSALTRLVNLVLQGQVPASARAAFYAASLIALRKPCGGIRPIAIGSTYRRLATKFASRPFNSELGARLRPNQLGFGTSGGCEAAVHATRLFARTLPSDNVLVKIDMRNAFNCVRRDHFLREVRVHAPSLFPLLWQAYSEPTPLYHGTSVIWSATGLQQGDPSGPAVFSLAVQSVISAVTSPLNVWYLDDGTLGGGIDGVCADLRQLIPAMARVGLEVNPTKCEIINSSAEAVQDIATVEKLHQLIPGAAVVADFEQTVLGAPLTSSAAETALRRRQVELDRMITRLQLLDSHSAFYLLRHSLWLPRLQDLLRAAPVYLQPELLELDADLKSAVQKLTNVYFDEASWQQAILPTSLGGLGLRRTVDVALPGFAASLHRCQQVLSSLLPPSYAASITKELDQSTNDWLAKADGKVAPDVDSRSQQKKWDYPLAECQRNAQLAVANQFERARLLSAATPESGAWMQALPSASLGTLLDNNTVRITIVLRVGADVCSEHLCKCGAQADSKGYQFLTCRFSAGRLPRHTALNEIVRRALQSAGVPALLEPHGINRGDGKRPDGMTIFPFTKGQCLVWDATCVNTYADSHLASAVIQAGAAAADAEEEKRRKYSELCQRFRFEPVAFETSGSCGPSTRKLLQEIGAQVSAVTGERRETEWLLQRCSIAVIRGNAASILLTRSSEEERCRQGHSNGGKTYQNEDSPRRRSPPRRRTSPLRAPENESLSPRRSYKVPRRGDGSL